ncbi:MAG: ABC transporter substrate-binding protein [Termitinemataceae bacterium]|nr:MAG: ABC transporter substrate-binding protein [Termitinemataceae bacterium]
MKKFFLLLCLFAAAFLGAQEKLTVYTLKGPSGVGMVQLFEKPPTIRGFTVNIEALSDSQLMAARLISGEAKIGILPPNVAAKIASGGQPLQIAAITGEGMLSLLSSDPKIKVIKDLKGKEVSIAGQGAVPEFVFRKVLSSNNLNPDKDVKMNFSLAYPEIAQSLIAGRIKTAIIPEPFAVMALQGNEKLKNIGNIQEEWAKSKGLAGSAENAGNYPITVLVVNSDFAKKNPAVVSAVAKSVKESITWVKANPKEAAAAVEKSGLGIKAAVVEASIPRSAYCYIDAITGRTQLEALFKTFLEYAPASIGGKLPSDNFYLKIQ